MKTVNTVNKLKTVTTLSLAFLSVLGAKREEDEWASVKPGSTGLGEDLTKWDFNTAPEFVGILLKKATLPSQYAGEDYMLFTFYHEKTKRVFLVTCNQILRERVEKIKEGSRIRCKFTGIPKGKKYKGFDVDVSKNFVLDEKELKLHPVISEYYATNGQPGSEPKNREEFEDRKVSKMVAEDKAKNNAAGIVDDDLPF